MKVEYLIASLQEACRLFPGREVKVGSVNTKDSPQPVSSIQYNHEGIILYDRESEEGHG